MELESWGKSGGEAFGGQDLVSGRAGGNGLKALVRNGQEVLITVRNPDGLNPSPFPTHAELQWGRDRAIAPTAFTQAKGPAGAGPPKEAGLCSPGKACQASGVVACWIPAASADSADSAEVTGAPLAITSL